MGVDVVLAETLHSKVVYESIFDYLVDIKSNLFIVNFFGNES